ncbi:MAG: DUF4372 domain-containing protein [Geobacter sp.]|nr:DUF4372 domain-containing protein [Geobacter sp.]
MYSGKLIFSQVMERLPLHVFHQCAERYKGNVKIKDFTCLGHYLCMAFAPLTYRTRRVTRVGSGFQVVKFK